MPNKPDKSGIKFWLASDVNSKYLVNGFPYLGKDDIRPQSTSLSEFVVLKLVEPYTGHGRNITTDNFFTSLSLAKKLLSKRTTLVGTIRANKKELPKTAKGKKDNMTRFSTLLYKSEDCVLTIYKSKQKKSVSEELARDARSDTSGEKLEQEALDSVPTNTTPNSNKRKWCQIGSCNNNKTNNICHKCRKYVCGKCTSKKICTFICKNCLK